jgi:murein DD-endopeptidase MepM/ murein hydrolase activator NlpD
MISIATALTGRISDIDLPSLPSTRQTAAAPSTPEPDRTAVSVAVRPDVIARHQTEVAALSAPDTPEATPTPEPAATPEPTPQQLSFAYTIQSGDTIDGIAAAFGINPSYILWNNPDVASDPNLLIVGETLVIPGADGILHHVTFGDTLWDISMAYGVTMDSIVGYGPNGLLASNSVIEGMVLLVPGAVPPAPPEPEPVYVAAEPEPAPAEPAPVAAGAPVSAPVPSPYGFIWPYVANISTYFGEDGHRGIDIEGLGNEGAPVVAAASGQVVLVVWSEWAYGNHVIIDHGDGTQTLYAHLSDIYVVEGQYVTQGDAVGAIGNTGYSTGPHLHFEVRLNGVPVDPLDYLP